MIRRDPQPDSAFTLIEVILVLVLIALISAAATPALRGFTQRGNLDDTAAALLTLTQQAHTRAAHESIRHRVVVDAELRVAWLERIGDEGYVQVTATGVEPVTWSDALTIVSDIQPDAYQRLNIDFDPLGLVTPGSFVLERDRHIVALTCDAVTGSYRLVTPTELEGVDLRSDDAREVLDAMRL